MAESFNAKTNQVYWQRQRGPVFSRMGNAPLHLITNTANDSKQSTKARLDRLANDAPRIKEFLANSLKSANTLKTSIQSENSKELLTELP